MKIFKPLSLIILFVVGTLFAQSVGTKPDLNHDKKTPLNTSPKEEVRVNKNVIETTIFSDGFESYANGDLDIGEWTNYDGDAGTIGGINGFTFPHQGEAIAWTVVDWTPSATIPAHTGTKTIATMYNDPVVANNDWIISPKIYLPATLTNAYLSFWTYILTTQYGSEYLSVYVTDNPNALTPGDFPATATQAYVINTATTWEERLIALDSFIGDTIRIALKYHSSDVFTVLVDDFLVGSVAGPGLATNPTPTDGATGVDINADLSWTNPAGTTAIEVFFGTSATNLTSVYSGSPVTTHALATMPYNTRHYWRIDATDVSGTSTGTVWSFTTAQDPNDPTVFLQTFEEATYPPAGWSLEYTGTAYWTRQTTASGYGVGAASSRFAFYNATGGTTQSLITESFSPTGSGTLTFDHAYASYTGGENDQLQIEYSLDNGTSWNVLVLLNGGNSGELVTAPGQSGAFVPTAAQWATKNYTLPLGTTTLKFKAISAFGNNLFLDNISVTNIVPVELTSFVATTGSNSVTLNWSTATETNNKGFEIERSFNGSEFKVIGYKEGNGTTTQVNNYSFVDQNLSAGNYSYRLRQIDYDGTFEYSKVVESSIIAPATFAMEQNYPNPFNPTTNIKFSLAVDSKVTLKVFNILGQEVATLINNTMAAGFHSVKFDAKGFQSGIYLAKIEANGIDGKNFSSVKKMVLAK